MYWYFLLSLLQFFVAEISTSRDGSCSGGFDVYFVLDRSTSVSRYNFQNQTVQFVKNIISHLTSPKLRASFIVFSNEAEVILPLTSDRQEIETGINKLRKINPGGTTYIYQALENVRRTVEKKGPNTASVLIILTDGTLYDKEQSIGKTNELRKVGTTVFAIGVEGFKLVELKRLASLPSEDHVFTAPNYKALQLISETVINKACVEVSMLKSKTVCIEKKTDIELYGKGFSRTYDKSHVTCSFQLNDTYQQEVKAIEVTDSKITCQLKAESSFNSEISVRISLNGKTFFSSDHSIQVKTCKKVNHAPGILITLAVLLFIMVFVSWWFWFLLPCVKERPKRSSVLLPISEQEVSPPQSPTKKWDTVDTSYYGGGGVGGIKSVKVKWGDKGATEAGKKLTQTPDAKVISKTSTSSPPPPLNNSKNNNQKPSPSLFSQLKLWIAGLWNSLSERRPRKHGISECKPEKAGKFSNSGNICHQTLLKEIRALAYNHAIT